MNIVEYRKYLEEQAYHKRLKDIQERTVYLKEQIKGNTDNLPEPLNFENATVQLSILEDILALEEELGMHESPIEHNKLG